jgi:ABC-type transporter Mla subunit MlaD
MLRQIDAELKKSLDFNDKAFKKEMFRLQTIATALQANSQNKKKILTNISELTRLLGDSSAPLSMKENIPKLIAIAYESLANESSESMSKLRLMSEFDSNQKLIKGD